MACAPWNKTRARGTLGDIDYIDIQTGLHTENQPIRIDIEIQRGKKQTTQDASLGERNTKNVSGSRKNQTHRLQIRLRGDEATMEYTRGVAD
jgi:hypothetical protein